MYLVIKTKLDSFSTQRLDILPMSFQFNVKVISQQSDKM